MNRPGLVPPRGRTALAVLGIGLAVGLSGCGTGEGVDFTPKPVVTITPSTPSPSSTATQSPTASQSPTNSPSATPAVKASGSLTFFKANLVSDTFKGTCRTAGEAPTISLADSKNDFYGTVELEIVLDRAKKQVASIAGDFGEDSELITRQIAYNSAKPAKGTSAALKTSGNTYTITGKAEMFEDGTATDPIPFTIKAKCARTGW